LDWIKLTGYVPVAGSCERGNESSGYIKCEEFLYQLSHCELVREDCCTVMVEFFGGGGHISCTFCSVQYTVNMMIFNIKLCLFFPSCYGSDPSEKRLSDLCHRNTEVHSCHIVLHHSLGDMRNH
jgi:hypothetical protein